MSLIAVLASTITFGLFHGVNPSHGWPIATLYSMRSKRPFVSGFISSSILAGAHFVSSIIVVLVYILVSTLIEIPQIYLHYGAAIGLGILAIIFWKEKSEDYVKTQHGHLHNHDFGINMMLVMNIHTGIRVSVIILMNIFIKSENLQV